MQHKPLSADVLLDLPPQSKALNSDLLHSQLYFFCHYIIVLVYIINRYVIAIEYSIQKVQGRRKYKMDTRYGTATGRLDCQRPVPRSQDGVDYY